MARFPRFCMALLIAATCCLLACSEGQPVEPDENKDQSTAGDADHQAQPASSESDDPNAHDSEDSSANQPDAADTDPTQPDDTTEAAPDAADAIEEFEHQPNLLGLAAVRAHIAKGIGLEHGPGAPFTGDEIREGTPQGRKYTFLQCGMNKATNTMRFSFTSVDEEGATMSFELMPGRNQDSQVTWAELEGHGEFPKDTTLRYSSTLEILGEQREVWVYVTQGKGFTNVNVFAKDMPGAPVYVKSYVDSKQVGGMLIDGYE